MPTKLEQRLDRVDQLTAEAEATDGLRGESFFKSFLQPPATMMATSLLGKACKQYQTNPTEDVRERILLASQRLARLVEGRMEQLDDDEEDEEGCTWFEEILLFLDSHVLDPIERASWRLRGVSGKVKLG